VPHLGADAHRRDFRRAARAIWEHYELAVDARLELGARDLLRRARLLISHLGHAPVEAMSDPRGLSLYGAVYLAAGYYGGHTDVEMPVLCASHIGRRGRFPRPCEPGCESRLWGACNQAFAYLVEAGRTSSDGPLHLGRVRVRPQADLCDLRDLDLRLDTGAALTLLRRAETALTVTVPARASSSSAYALAGAA